jgi:hypothetical protein
VIIPKTQLQEIRREREGRAEDLGQCIHSSVYQKGVASGEN